MRRTDDPALQRRHQHPAGADKPSDTMLIGTVDGVALLGKSERGWAVKHRALQGVFVSRRHGARRRHAVRLDPRRRHGAQRRRRLQVDLGQRGAGAPRVLVVPGRQAAGPRRGVRRRAAGASLCQRGQGQVLARAQRVARRQDGGSNGPSRRRRASAISRTSCSMATGCGSASRSARCRCRPTSAQSFTELVVDPDPQECDIHRILVHPARPNRIIIANGIVGMMSSEDGGKTFTAHEDAGRGELSRRRRHPSRPAGPAVHVGRRRLAGALVRARPRARQDFPQPRCRKDLGASARRIAERPARAVQRPDHRGAAGRLFAARGRHRRRRCSRASTTARAGPSSPTCRRCRRPISTRGCSATASSSPMSTTSSPTRPPPSVGRKSARGCNGRSRNPARCCELSLPLVGRVAERRR